MGMFDDITVPKSYLKGLLTKEQEKLINDNNYQTKSLENALRRYKIYKQKLFINDRDVVLQEKEDSKWVPVKYTGEVLFYNNIKDGKGNQHWVEFRFIFLNGKLDAKYLEEFFIGKTIGEIEEENRKWKEARIKQLKYESTFEYKFYFFIFKILTKLLYKVRVRVDPHSYDYGTRKIE
jgi:hypothetical protein